jgi:hypothetical protein
MSTPVAFSTPKDVTLTLLAIFHDSRKQRSILSGQRKKKKKKAKGTVNSFLTLSTDPRKYKRRGGSTPGSGPAGTSHRK